MVFTYQVQSTPNWMYKFTLDIGDAYNEIEGRGQTLCYSRCNSCRSGITYIYGRQSCDTRSMEGGDLDAGNSKFSGQEAMIILIMLSFQMN